MSVCSLTPRPFTDLRAPSFTHLVGYLSYYNNLAGEGQGGTPLARR